MTLYNVSSGATDSGLILVVGDVLRVGGGGSAIDITLAGGTEIVSSGGVVSGTTVSSGGVEYVSDGGVTSGTTVSAGGVEYVSYGGVASGTIVSSGGVESVSFGGVTSGTTVSSGGTEVVSGIATGTIVGSGGTQVLTGAGAASGTTVSSGGVEYVSGGLASGTTVSSGGELIALLYGAVSGATIDSGGTLITLAGASNISYTASTGATIISAYMIVDSGGVLVSAIDSATLSDFAVGSGEVLTVYSGGTVESAVISSGKIEVSGGGVVTGTTISSGGTEYVLFSGIASGTTVSSGGTEVVSGIASGTIVGSGGTQILIEGGYGSGTTVSFGGVQNVSSGGFAAATTVSSGGVQNVSNGGVASGTAISSGGAEYVLAGGTATGTTISSGGELSIVASAFASNTTVNAGGEMFISGIASSTTVSSGGQLIVFSGGSLTNTTLDSGGTLYLLPDASVTGTVGDGTVVSANILLFNSSGEVVGGGTGSDYDNLVLNSGQTEEIYSGGSVTGTTLSLSGNVSVDSGGTVMDTTISAGGFAIVYPSGTAISTTIDSNGAFLAGPGSFESDTTLNSGAVFYVSSGGTVTSMTVHSGGEFYVDNGAIVSDTTVEAGALIDVSLQYVSGESSAVYSGSELTVTEGGSSITLNLSGDYTNDYFTLSDDGSNRTLITVEGTPCYCRGTRIATERGEVAVEDLVIGDMLLTASGALRPIRWIGRRSYSGQFAATNRAVMPVMFLAGSLDDAIPARDLMVSPLHAMYLQGVLVPAEALVNTVSILRMEGVDRVDYFHIELQTHDVIIAEGALSETFVDDGSRGMFHNAAEYRVLYPEALREEARYCAPRVEDGEVLAAINRTLLLRATGGDRPAKAGPLRGCVDSVEAGQIAGWAFNDMTPQEPVYLRIIDGEHVLAEIISDTYRRDLADAQIGNGYHAFKFTVPGGLSPDRRHVIRVVRSADGLDLESSPWVIEADPAMLPSVLVRPNGPVTAQGQGFLDYASRQRIVGWAFDSAHGSEAVTVQIFDNGQCIAQMLANTSRPDLEVAGYGNGRFGFDILLPVGLSPLSRHVIQVCRAHDGVELQGSPMVIEAADSFDVDLAQTVTRIVDGLTVGQDCEKVLSFLLSQAERLRQRQADEASGREASERRRRLIRRFGESAAQTDDRRSVQRALIIDERLPDAARDAGSCAILSHMRGLQALGFTVSFVAASEMDAIHGAAIRTKLQSEGVMCWHSPYYASVEDLLRKQAGAFDAVYLHRVSNASRYMALTRQHQQRACVIYSVADLHHVRLERQAVFEDRPELLAEARNMRVVECTAAWQADAVITHSSEEVERLRHLVPAANVYQVPWAIESPVDREQDVERHGVLFIGHYGHAPNVDAAQWLVRDIMPHVWVERPEIHCILAGSTMPTALQRLAGERVEVVGHTPDLGVLFKRVMVSVAPLRYGAGIKGKVLDSLGHGVPCVMSDIAAEGLALSGALLSLKSGMDAQEIARRILTLHDDRAAYEQLRVAGLAMIRDHHDMATVTEGLREAIGVDHLPAILTSNAS